MFLTILPKTLHIFACVVNAIQLRYINFCEHFDPTRSSKVSVSPFFIKSFLCSLALMDLFVRLVVLPLFTAYYLMIIVEISRYYCVIAITYGRTSTFIGAACLETITIAVDRHLAFHVRLTGRIS